MNVVSMMRVMLCASDMQTIPIFTGPFQNLKYQGLGTRKNALFMKIFREKADPFFFWLTCCLIEFS